ncbi:hypothetical protein [Amycolatopsis acidicola]|uniref:hypothetical protein n=1 Tax=Amycolatopsis acidicola TaxID=2596893 RepID=UPI001AA054DF|nr:hypothetical protein [Amycolatopsis acidicola]
MDFALPRHLSRAARTTVKAVRSLPRLTTVLTELRDAVQQIERLATFAAQELPEVVYQLESIRGQLTALERRLTPGSPHEEVMANGDSAEPHDKPITNGHPAEARR